MAEYFLDGDRTPGPVALAVGDMVTVRVEEPSGGGYRWMFEDLAEGPAVLLGTRVQPVGAVGGGGIRQFSFRCVRAGRCTAQLRLARPWEAQDQAVKRIDIEFVVSDARRAD